MRFSTVSPHKNLSTIGFCPIGRTLKVTLNGIFHVLAESRRNFTKQNAPRCAESKRACPQFCCVRFLLQLHRKSTRALPVPAPGRPCYGNSTVVINCSSRCQPCEIHSCERWGCKQSTARRARCNQPAPARHSEAASCTINVLVGKQNPTDFSVT